MSRTIGGVDDEGQFHLTTTYYIKDPDEVEEMIAVLQNPELYTTVDSYDDDHVMVKIWVHPSYFEA